MFVNRTTVMNMNTIAPHTITISKDREDQNAPPSSSLTAALVLLIPVLFNDELVYLVRGQESEFMSVMDVPIAMLYVLLYMWYAKLPLSSIGLGRPASWKKTIRNGILLAIGVQVLATVVGTVLTITFKALGLPGMNISTFNAVSGNVSVLLYWLAISWTTAGFGEEFLLRGFMLTYLIILLSRYLPEKYVKGTAVALTAITFGLMHLYQGLFGVFMTGFAGLLLAIIFQRYDRNLWLVILVHGIMNSLGFLFLFFT